MPQLVDLETEILRNQTSAQREQHTNKIPIKEATTHYLYVSNRFCTVLNSMVRDRERYKKIEKEINEK